MSIWSRAGRSGLPSCELAAGRELEVGIVERRLLVEAEAVHVLEHRVGAELLADLRPPGVDRVGQRRVMSISPNCSPPALFSGAPEISFGDSAAQGRVRRRTRRCRAPPWRSPPSSSIPAVAGLGRAVEERRVESSLSCDSLVGDVVRVVGRGCSPSPGPRPSRGRSRPPTPRWPPSRLDGGRAVRRGRARTGRRRPPARAPGARRGSSRNSVFSPTSSSLWASSKPTWPCCTKL